MFIYVRCFSLLRRRFCDVTQRFYQRSGVLRDIPKKRVYFLGGGGGDIENRKTATVTMQKPPLSRHVLIQTHYSLCLYQISELGFYAVLMATEAHNIRLANCVQK